jgi:hypothetical protein
LVVIYCFSFCFSWKTFIAPSILNEFFSIEKSAVSLMGLPLYVICFFSLIAFSILSLVSVLILLMIICNGLVYFGQAFLVFRRLPVPKWA